MTFRIPPTPTYERDLERLEKVYRSAFFKLVRQLESVDPFDLVHQKLYESQIQQIIHIIHELTGESREWFEEHLTDAFSHAQASAMVTMGLSTSLVEAKGDTQFSLMSRNRIDSIISDTFSDVLKAHSVMEENLKQLVRNVQAEVLRENFTLQRNSLTAGRELRSALLEQGFSRSLLEEQWKGIVDARGRRWDLTTYTSMVAKTKLQQAQREGARLQALENDNDLAIISSHGAKDACRHFEGMIISMNGTVAGFKSLAELQASNLIFHPNCQHQVHPIGDIYALPKTVLEKAIKANESAEYALKNRDKIIREDNARRYRENKEKIARMRRRRNDRKRNSLLQKPPEKVFKFEPEKTKLYKDMMENLHKGKRLVDMEGESGMYVSPENVRDIFGDKVTKEGLLHVFNPDPSRYTTEFSRLVISGQPNLSVAELRVGVFDKNGKQVATVDRAIVKAGDRFIVKNELLEFDKSVQGSGLATNIYFKTEQLYKHIAKGKPVNIELLANLDVGTYAWSRHGFDFKDPDEIEYRRDALKNLIEENLDKRLKSGEFGKPKVDITKEQWKEMKPKLFQQELERMGYTDLAEIKHAWQFGALDDGRKYPIHTNGSEGHLGKYLMLRYDSWEGVKRLNQNHDSETIGNLYFERKGVV